jgi:hypothetical protein
VFAPGHLGELTRYLPFELVDEVLAETGCAERRLRDLPSRVGVYFVLGLALFPDLGYGQVWGKLVAGLAGVPGWPSPTAKALPDLRRRVAEKPLSALFKVVAVCLPKMPSGQVSALRSVCRVPGRGGLWLIISERSREKRSGRDDDRLWCCDLPTWP